jgi:hypothetical protein
MLLSKSLANLDLNMYCIYDHMQSNSVTKARQGLCCVAVTYYFAYVSYHLRKCKMLGFEYLKKAVNNICRASDAPVKPVNACALSVLFVACVGRLYPVLSVQWFVVVVLVIPC